MPPSTPSQAPKNPLRILMLHGFTQSGPLFRAKTRALEKHLQKSLPLHDLELIYPTGPIPLDPTDVPGYTPSEADNNSNTTEKQQEPENFAWWRRSNTSDPVEYNLLEIGFQTLADILQDQGPFDGVIGFSQGAACAAILASLLEPGRREAFAYFSDPKNNALPSVMPSTPELVTGIPFPAPFENVTHPPLKFAVCYSGFRAPGPRYRAFYERPLIRTPILHVLGSLDAIVDEGRSKALIEACEVGVSEKEDRIMWHPGGHFLPSQRPYLDGVVRFVRGCLDAAAGSAENGNGKGKLEQGVEDMDVPF